MPKRHVTIIDHDEPLSVELGQPDPLKPYGRFPQSWVDLGWIAAMSEGEIKVAVTLCRYVNTEGICWPGTALIQQQSGMSHGTVFSALKRLEAFGLIERRQRQGKKTYYTIKPATRHAAIPRSVQPIGHVQPAGGVQPPGRVGWIEPVQPTELHPSNRLDTNNCSNNPTNNTGAKGRGRGTARAGAPTRIAESERHRIPNPVRPASAGKGATNMTSYDSEIGHHLINKIGEGPAEKCLHAVTLIDHDGEESHAIDHEMVRLILEQEGAPSLNHTKIKALGRWSSTEIRLSSYVMSRRSQQQQHA